MELGSIFDTLVPINVFYKKPTLGVIGNQMSYGAKIKKNNGSRQKTVVLNNQIRLQIAKFNSQSHQSNQTQKAKTKSSFFVLLLYIIVLSTQYDCQPK